MEYLTFIYFVAPPAWAFVGQGSNMEPRSDYSVNPPKVIVSRSHSGKVTSYIKKAFGNSTNIISAGGAGEQRILKKGREFLKGTEYTFLIQKVSYAAGAYLLLPILKWSFTLGT